jgi:hypothetical protein
MKEMLFGCVSNQASNIRYCAFAALMAVAVIGKVLRLAGCEEEMESQPRHTVPS